MINFLAEISKRAAFPVNPTPSNGVKRQYNIYQLDTGPLPDDSYWLAWGGYDDRKFSERIELYYSKFLKPVNSLNSLQSSPYSYYADNNTLYINIPVHPWIYGGYSAGVEDVYPYLSFALNENDPAELTLIGKTAHTKLAVPSINVKLSENISGVVLHQGFSLTLANEDGCFDRDPPSFNAPVTVKKSVINNPAYEDFKTIRRGLLDKMRIDFSSITIEASDFLRSLSEPVCELVSREMFYFPIDGEAIGKPIPVIYGTRKTGLIKLGNNRILVAEYASYAELYDREKNLVFSASTYNPLGNPVYPAWFTVPDDVYKNADYAVVSGYGTGYHEVHINKAGLIIGDLIAKKTQFSYNDSFWNIEETGLYADYSPELDIIFSGGDVSKAVNEVLKSDMAYLIQQADGRLSIRKWGQPYAEHYLDSWKIMPKPSLDYSKAQENYFSSCGIAYINCDDPHTDEKLNYVFDENRNRAELLYRKIKVRDFETNLTNIEDAENLARLLSGRYTFLKPSLKLPLGIDTSGFELLDTVYIKADINGRLFTEHEKYVITEINQAQDMLALEAVD